MEESNVTAVTFAPVTVFDVDGDLRLEVGAESPRGKAPGIKESEKDPSQVFLVCSKTLSRASKPFKAMLYGPFTESKHNQNDHTSAWTVRLPEDDPKAFAMLMNIIHNKFNLVPSLINRDDLFHISVLTNKYDMTEVLRPWAQRWILALSDSLDGADWGWRDERYLWIAWELGHRKLFCDTLRWLQDDCTLDSSGKLGCYPFKNMILSEDPYLINLEVPERLTQERARVLAAKLGFLNRTINKLADTKYAGDFCRIGYMHGKAVTLADTQAEEAECQIFYLGAFVKALYSARCFPLPSPGSYTGSISELDSNIYSACRNIAVLKKLPRIYLHDRCFPTQELEKEFRQICSNTDLTKAQEQHFEHQSARTGILEGFEEEDSTQEA